MLTLSANIVSLELDLEKEETYREGVSRGGYINGRSDWLRVSISSSSFLYIQGSGKSNSFGIDCEWLRLNRKLMAQVKVQLGSVKVVRTTTVNIESLDVERCIRQFDLTLIGRVWNPQFEHMDSLIYHMPKTWKLEDKVVGADLGDGKFHFKFQSEAELKEVLRNAPYHYDSWMVSVVRWEPSVAEDYPSEITFWARVKGLPFQYGAADSLWSVGEALGTASEVDEDARYVRVSFNGFEPLISTVIIPYSNGDEVKVYIAYDKLANHCQHCFRLTHLASYCPELSAQAWVLVRWEMGPKNLRRTVWIVENIGDENKSVGDLLRELLIHHRWTRRQDMDRLKSVEGLVLRIIRRMGLDREMGESIRKRLKDLDHGRFKVKVGEASNGLIPFTMVKPLEPEMVVF